MVRLEEHKQRMESVKEQIKASRQGPHRQDLIRQLNKLQREYKQAIGYLKGR